MSASSTAAGMKNYKPRRPGTTMDDVVTPEIRAKRKAMMDEAADQNAQPALDKTYEAARTTMKKGGSIKKMSAGGYTRAADGIAQRGKTRGKMC
jgi:hypothetical protein